MEVLATYLGTTGPVCQIVPVPRGGFSGARIWRIQSNRGLWALRRWPRGSMDLKRLLQLHALLDAIQSKCEVPIAVPVANAEGQTLTFTGGDWYQLEPWLDGQPAAPASITEQQLEAAMRALAEWHLAAQQAVELEPADSATGLILPGRTEQQSLRRRGELEPRSSARWFTSTTGPSHALNERSQLLRAADPAELRRLVIQLRESETLESARELWELIDEHCALLDQSRAVVCDQLAGWLDESLPLQPCLRDIWSEHVLLTGDRVTGLIDPSAARTDSVAADLARLIPSYVGSEPHAWDRAIAAYSEVRPLSSAERRLIVVLDRAAILLSPLTWLDRLRNRRVESAQLPDVVVRVSRLVDRHRCLLSQRPW